MLPVLSSLLLAQIAEPPAPPDDPGRPAGAATRTILIPQAVRSLPGQLDDSLMFNSNSPEVVRQDGILLSTFSPAGKAHPEAHLNYTFNGRFAIFAHHIARSDNPYATPTLYQGLLLANPSAETVTVNINQAASFLSTPDAPFVSLPTYVDNPVGNVYSGPGSRAMSVILRGRRQPTWPFRVVIPPGETRVLASLPIPLPRLSNRPLITTLVPQDLLLAQNLVTNLNPNLLQPVPPDPPPPTYASSNGRSTLAHLFSDGPVQVASLAFYAPVTWDGREQIPQPSDWANLIVSANLAGPRDVKPTPLDLNPPRFFYGRVAGVAQGMTWRAEVTDAGRPYLVIPARGEAISYGLSTLNRGTLGTGQVQSAPLKVRYPDTAYLAHGNYGIHYDLTFPLLNPTAQTQTVTLSVQSPLKEDRNQGGLRFLDPPEPRVFFRGTIRLRYTDDRGQNQTRYVHVVKHRGQQGDPLISLNLSPGEERMLQV
ncbi:MAG: DUF3370 domain-containing protein, partial [Gloeomargaritaceae cyanobacterium C42_A2020_066]|nr:DUF3370 domain-containing protein [Gloeomargaritaceae cyanobacterium C42_A2020_066]